MKAVSFCKTVIIISLMLAISCSKEEEKPYVPMTIQSTVSEISEYGLNDGSIDITVIGGEEPYFYLWSNSQQCEDLEHLCPGIYSIQITDNKSQIISDTFELNQPAPDTLKVKFTAINPSETGAANGSILTEINGGYPPFTFLWSDGASTKNRENLQVGEYLIKVQDSRGQIVTDTIYLYDFLTDFDGNEYNIVKIGTQSWMQQNLRVTHDSEGNSITAYTYANNPELAKTYGCLYTWQVAMNGSTEEGAQGICPKGWHIPSDNDFKILEMFLGMTEAESNMTNAWRGNNVGTALKVGGNSGYNAVLAGRRSTTGAYSLAGRMEYMWTSNEYGNNAWRRCLDNNAHTIGRWNTFSKNYGFSIRCIKNN